jgi:putative transcriptional regulator
MIFRWTNMSPGCCYFLGFVVAAVQLSGFANVSMATRAEAQEHTSLAGQLLIASPRMTSPVFSRTVIIVVRHEKTGAMGIVINRPIGDRSLASLLEASGDKATTAEGSVRVYRGGPIEPGIGFVIHTTDYRSPPTIRIDERIAVTSSREILRDIGRNRGPQKSLIAFGYAGWAPGQLEAEIGQGFWFTTPEDPGLVFDKNPETIWEEAIKRRTQDL